MKAIVEGVMVEKGSRTSSKTGESVPFVVLYSDKDTVQVFGYDGTNDTMYSTLCIPVSISVGNYGLYVKFLSE